LVFGHHASGTPSALTSRRLLAAATVVACGVFTAGASASVQRCSYRNLASGEVPYVAQVTTNLTSAGAHGASICKVVREAVLQVQRRGYNLDGSAQLRGPHGYWALSHHLVYPRGWPRPTGPVCDPHMHVTLRMVAVRHAGSRGTGADTSRMARYWITLNEYT